MSQVASRPSLVIDSFRDCCFGRSLWERLRSRVCFVSLAQRRSCFDRAGLNLPQVKDIHIRHGKVTAPSFPHSWTGRPTADPVAGGLPQAPVLEFSLTKSGTDITCWHTETPYPPFRLASRSPSFTPLAPLETSLRLTSRPVQPQRLPQAKEAMEAQTQYVLESGEPHTRHSKLFGTRKGCLGRSNGREFSGEVPWRPETNQKLSNAWALGRGLERLPPHSGCAFCKLGEMPHGKVVAVLEGSNGVQRLEAVLNTQGTGYGPTPGFRHPSLAHVGELQVGPLQAQPRTRAIVHSFRTGRGGARKTHVKDDLNSLVMSGVTSDTSQPKFLFEPGVNFSISPLGEPEAMPSGAFPMKPRKPKRSPSRSRPSPCRSSAGPGDILTVDLWW